MSRRKRRSTAVNKPSGSIRSKLGHTRWNTPRSQNTREASTQMSKRRNFKKLSSIITRRSTKPSGSIRSKLVSIRSTCVDNSRVLTNPPTSPKTREASTQTQILDAGRERQSVYKLRRPAINIDDEEPYLVQPIKRNFIVEMAKNFSVFTSFDGIAHIFLSHKRNPKSWKNKVYLLAFLLFIAFDLYYMVSVTNRYLEYEVITKEIRFHYTSMDFPGVTICNMNKMKKGNHSPFYPPKRELETGHTLKEMMIKCSFAGISCDTSDFHWFWSNNRGNCYTFNNHKNAAGEEIPSKKLSHAGKKASLILVLDANHHIYSPKTERFGMMVSVHDRSERPEVSKKRELSTGFWLTGLMKMNLHKHYATHGKCLRATKETNRERNFYAAEYTYSRTSCKSTCVQVKAMKEFKCCIKSYPCNPLGMKTMFGEKLNPTMKLCNTSEPNGMTKAQYKDWLDHKRAECADHCLPACDKTEYQTLYSSKDWPRKGSVDYDFYMQRERTTYNCCETEMETFGSLKDNLMVLELFFPFFDVTLHKDEPKYTIASVLAGIGALLGACVGFSLTTALEIGEFLHQALCGCSQPRL